MLILLSPAKTFSKHPIPSPFHIEFKEKTFFLLHKLKKVSIKKLEKEMHISHDIAKTVYGYYQDFGHSSYQALSLFDGQAFKGLDYMSLDLKTKAYAKSHLRIIDALYGLIAPEDGISTYRLEMQEKMIGNLYHYWKKTINDYLKSQEKVMINLASQEYSQVLSDDLNILTIDFRQTMNGKTKSISMHTKKARGEMARHILMHQIDDRETLKSIQFDGYHFDPSLSDANTFMFIKEFS